MDISKWCEFCKMCAVDPVTDPEHVVRICENGELPHPVKGCGFD